ncbi:complement factor B [Austrofundulus limnaeus]|uniref:Complement factor B n=1 Tax=Austrofundulus limnaeus TaxID=52670 RepID=A0A2I4ASZ9_AUSLI|nr:PREDICTED: complement factor B-like [Austrofundulus limnaeus]
MFTDGAYNMGGSPRPTVERIKNMVYMNDMANVGSRDEYLDIYIFAIGADLFDDDLQPLTVGTGGSHYFRLNDKDLREAFDTIIGPTTSSPQAPPPVSATPTSSQAPPPECHSHLQPGSSP